MGKDVAVVVLVGGGAGMQWWWLENERELLPYSCTTVGV